MPAAPIGSVPAAFVRGFGWPEPAMLVFQRGLRRYESGSAITAQS